MDPNVWIREYHKEEEDFSSCITCKECPSVKRYKGPSRVTDFIKHLRFVHKITGVNNHPQANILNEKYKITEDRGIAYCRRCRTRIQFDLGVWLLENHLRICQPDEVYTKMKVLSLDHQISSRYIIINSKEMKCSRCEYKVDDVVSFPEEKVQLLHSHWYSHVRKKYFLYLLKRAKIELILFVCINIFIIILKNRNNVAIKIIFLQSKLLMINIHVNIHALILYKYKKTCFLYSCFNYYFITQISRDFIYIYIYIQGES